MNTFSVGQPDHLGLLPWKPDLLELVPVAVEQELRLRRLGDRLDVFGTFEVAGPYFTGV